MSSKDSETTEEIHPLNVRDAEEVGKHCWHPQPRPPVGFRNRHTGNEVICCLCGTPAQAGGQPQSWHGPFADESTIGPFFFIVGHPKDEPCPGPPAPKSRLVLQ